MGNLRAFAGKLRRKMIGGSFAEINVKYNALKAEHEALKIDYEKQKKQMSYDRWGYDRYMADSQLFAAEQCCPGNKARIEALSNTHESKRCFVIGNGPSLTASDLELLHENKEFCFASKGIFHIFDQTNWRPNVWGVSDWSYFLPHEEEIRNLSGFIKFLPCQAITRYNMVMNDALYYPFLSMERSPFGFNLDITLGVHFYTSITCKLINIAAYMGFKEIYLLGVDDSAKVISDEDGNTKIVVSHFSDNYNKGSGTIKVQMNDFYKENVSRIYSDIKYHCEWYGIRIYNATRGGVLETFERVKLEDVFQHKT